MPIGEMRTTVKFLLLVTVFRPVNEDSFVVNPLDVQFLDEKARYDNENYLVKDGMLRRKNSPTVTLYWISADLRTVLLSYSPGCNALKQTVTITRYTFQQYLI